LRFNILTVQDLNGWPNVTVNQCPCNVSTILCIRQRGVSGESMCLLVSSTSIRGGIVVGRLNFKFPEIVDGCLNAVIVRPHKAINLLNMGSESSIELLPGTCFGGLKLRQYPPFPLVLSNLLRLSNPVRTVFGVIGCCECICWIIDLSFDAVDVRLNLFDMRREILIVIRLHMWLQIIASLEVGLT